jgi:hypothetical protein
MLPKKKPEGLVPPLDDAVNALALQSGLSFMRQVAFF